MRMVHPSVLQEDRLRELDRLLQRVTQRAVEAASTRDHKPTPPTLPQGEILTPLFLHQTSKTSDISTYSV